MNLGKKKIFSFTLIPLFAVGFFLVPLTFSPLYQPRLGIAHGQQAAIITKQVMAQILGGATSGCSWTSVVDPATCIAAGANEVLAAAGYFTALGGITLNAAIEITVLNMGQFVNPSGGITKAWVILRDLANIGLIFGLLAIGIGTILQLSGYGMRELLAKLIIIALLINFSLFVTKAIINVSNAVAALAYQQINSSQGPCEKGVTSCLSDKFMEALKLPTIYNVKDAMAKNGAVAGMSPANIILAGIFGSIIFIVAGLVFLAGAILLIIRFVMLIFLMIVAPIAWASFILPDTKHLWSKWWSTLWRESIFAPAYLILLLATLWITQDTALSTVTGGVTSDYALAILGKDVSAFKVFIHFGIIMGFLVASLILAKMMGSTGAGAITGYGKKLAKNAGVYARRGAGAATFGLTGVIGRNTLGRYAYNKAQDEGGLKKKVAAGGMRGLVAKAQLGVASYGSKVSYDPRAIPGLRGLSKDVELGTATKGGYEATRKQQERANASYAKGLGKRNAPAYAENVLAQRTFFSTLFMRTAARRKAAEKILEPIKDRAKRKEIKLEQQKLKDELKGIEVELEEVELEPLISGMQQDPKQKVELESKRKTTLDALEEKEIELEELKDKATSRKDEEKDAKGKKQTGEEGEGKTK